MAENEKLKSDKELLLAENEKLKSEGSYGGGFDAAYKLYYDYGSYGGGFDTALYYDYGSYGGGFDAGYKLYYEVRRRQRASMALLKPTSYTTTSARTRAATTTAMKEGYKYDFGFELPLLRLRLVRTRPCRQGVVQ